MLGIAGVMIAPALIVNELTAMSAAMAPMPGRFVLWSGVDIKVPLKMPGWF